MFTRGVLVTALTIALGACGGSDKDETVKIDDPVATVPELNAMALPLGSLTEQQGTNFERHLKNGIYLRNQSDLRINFAQMSEATSSDSAAGFSSTITQEQGVSEGDRIKYDGEYLFIAHQNANVWIAEDSEDKENEPQTAIRIMQRDDSGAMTEISELTVDEDANQIDSLYLHDNVLAVLSDIYSYHIDTMSFVERFFPFQQDFNVSMVDVSSPATPEVSLSYSIDGSMINSRRIGNMLYIISTYSASLDDIVYATTEQEKVDNYNKIMQTDITELMPHYRDAQGNEFPLVNAENCYLPEQATEKDGFDGIVTVTAINMAQPSQMNSVCINAEVQGIYASQESIYLYGTEYQYTDDKASETSVIHKFSLSDNTMSYRASGVLDGRFNWQLSNLRFSEQADYLRVVTTSGDGMSGYQHRLNVLSEDGNELSVVSQLPNDINSKLIGKVSDDGKVYEDIEAVRFYQDQAYIVTFLNTDPLYVIDLKDNLSPVIAGELEVPGYSAYLHPISNNLLLGIGQNVEPGLLSIVEGGEGSTDGTIVNDNVSPIVEGAKVSLFDISDISEPREIHSIVYENAYTPVEYDYHALTMLKMNDNSTRFALPIERWGTETRVDEKEQKYDVWFAENSLELFEVTGLTANDELVERGSIEAIQIDELDYASGWDDRSIFHGDDIYYIHGRQIWQSLWSDVKQVTGPH